VGTEKQHGLCLGAYFANTIDVGAVDDDPLMRLERS
jgi:hypothetical protein